MLRPPIFLALAVLPVMASGSFSTTQSEFSQQHHHSSVNTPLSELDKTQIQKRAKEWGLTTEEWLRYEQLKQGRRGVLSPGLDPITLLGIEARSDKERQHFADLSVKQDFQRVEAELAFQRAVNSAWRRVFPDMMPIQPDLASRQQNQERLALFVRADCALCDSKVASLIASQRLLDIYLVDSQGKDNRVRVWAKKLKLPVERVNNRTITLNHDRGQWLKFGKGRMPVVLQQGEMQ
ncbi:TIGR03759 family integrating conjugative element protein [Yersinia similis]|uniref:TIGR03759 family integrating conjugative element protein n=1 Tax=Yersinia similis TaxID=367190 RepID=UPI0005E748DC|nr:TIGR03759 family integrating conjugative element protein [Yersinia similis]CFQ70785.1 integrating conjugative element protein%2C PFL_4693 family [Yersinia similis]